MAIKALIDAEEESWLTEQLKRSVEQTETWPQWRQDSISEEDERDESLNRR